MSCLKQRPKRIAIIQTSEKHTEILGGIMTAFGHTNVIFDIYYEKYCSDFVTLYKKLLTSQYSSWKIYLHANKLPKKFDQDLTIFATGLEYIDEIEEFEDELDPKKTILVVHHLGYIKDLKIAKTCKVLALAPMFTNKRITNIIPVFHGLKPIPHKKIQLLIAGLTNPQNKDIKGVLKLLHDIDRSPEKFKNVVVNIINYYPLGKVYQPYINKGICKVYVNTTAITFMKLITKSDFVLTIANKNSSYHKEQLTGILPLAISCSIPLLMDTKLAKVYKMDKIMPTYDLKDVNSLSNAVQYHINVNKKYTSIISKLRNDIIKKNKQILFK